MRRSVALVALLAAAPAAAQLSGPLMLDPVTGQVISNRPFWQFPGSTCITTTVGGKPTIQCTITPAPAVTLQAAYNGSAGANPSILLTAANGSFSINGPAVAMGTLTTVKDGPTGSILLAQTDNGASYLGAIGTLQLGSGGAGNAAPTAITLGRAGITTSSVGQLNVADSGIVFTSAPTNSFILSGGNPFIHAGGTDVFGCNAGVCVHPVAVIFQAGVTASGTGDFDWTGSSGVIKTNRLTATTSLAVTTATGGALQMSAQNALGPGAFTTAQLPGVCTDGWLAWDSTTTQVKRCKTNVWTALSVGSSEWDFTIFNGLAAGAVQVAGSKIGQTLVTNAATLESIHSTSNVAGVGAGNLVTKLCSDGATCGGGNIYGTCTITCTSAVGTDTSCTVNISAVPAATTLTWSVTTACGTTNLSANTVTHFTNP